VTLKGGREKREKGRSCKRNQGRGLTRHQTRLKNQLQEYTYYIHIVLAGNIYEAYSFYFSLLLLKNKVLSFLNTSSLHSEPSTPPFFFLKKKVEELQPLQV
jgi:hypothetical protein